MIAYYAHSHGNGHLNTARLFCNAIYDHTVIITSRIEIPTSSVQVVHIENEDTLPLAYKNAVGNLPQYAHYLPKSNQKIVLRTRQILELIYKKDVNLALIDVSVETAIIFRIASVPYGYYLMPGDRKDNAHRIAYDASEFVYTFFPEVMFNNLSTALKKKCFFMGFYSRFNFTTEHCTIEAAPNLDGKSILIICGNGGTSMSVSLIKQLIDQVPMCTVHSVGNIENANEERLGFHLGYVSDIGELIAQHDIVISSCGMNLTSEILSLKNKFIAFAEERPYKEQLHIQKALERNGLAVSFSTRRFIDCLKSYLKLRPPTELQGWFMNENSVKKFKNKIENYEKAGNVLNNNLSQKVPTSIKVS